MGGGALRRHAGRPAAAAATPAEARGPAAARLRGAARALLDLLLPRACAACGGAMNAAEPGVVCGRCWARLALLPAPRCARCGHPAARHGACQWCPRLPPFVRAARSVCWVPEGSGAAIVHALKYDGWTAAAAAMAERMLHLTWPRDVEEERTALVPVPLAPVRLRERGYNQSELLARRLAAGWGVTVWPHVLARAQHAASQTQLTPEERRRNVSGAFRVVDGVRAQLRGAHLVLVDDVLTTGATLNACAAALHHGGARIVSYVTFARAHASGDRR